MTTDESQRVVQLGVPASPWRPGAGGSHTCVGGTPEGVALSWRIAFHLLLLYYWMILCLQDPRVPIEWMSAAYLAMVLPIGLFIVGLLPVVAYRMRKTSSPVWWLVAFTMSALIVSVARSDLRSIMSMGMLGAVLVCLFCVRFKLSFSLLNVVFLSSVPLAALTHSLDVNPYGVVPSIANIATGQVTEWRVSLFPSLPESAYFSGFLLLLNLCVRGLPLRSVVIPLAVYFLIFSGTRSAIIAALLAGTYAILARKCVSGRTGRMLMVLAAPALLVLAMSLSQLILLFGDLGNQTLNSYIFKSSDGVSSAEDLQRTVYRTWLWVEHMNIWLTSPLTGVGSFDFSSLASEELIAGHEGKGSESFFTALIARLGLVAILLFAGIVAAVRNVVVHTDGSGAIAAVILLVAGLAYGSFIVPYNFMFLVLFAVLASENERLDGLGQS